MTSFPVMECTVAQVHQAMLDGRLTCRELTETYLARIQSYDQQGPALNAIIAINPQALEEAERLDRQLRETGALSGPLHGIPVLLKDNVGTCDMPTTAGSRSLEGFVPSEDAFLTKRLRQAGALILAKTNLHEFAIWGETISSILGQTRNPYDLTRTPGGSSGGQGRPSLPTWVSSASVPIRSIPSAAPPPPTVWSVYGPPSAWSAAAGSCPTA